MPIRTYKPTSAGRRSARAGVRGNQRRPPEKSLSTRRRSGWPQQPGRAEDIRRGGGHKRFYRMVDFKRDKKASRDGDADRIRSESFGAHRADHLLGWREALHPRADGLEVGKTIMSGAEADILPGNTLPMINIPLGTQIHNIELHPGKGGQMARSAGTFAQLVAKEGEYAQWHMPSGEVRRGPLVCRRRWARSATSSTRTFRLVRPAVPLERFAVRRSAAWR